MSFKQSTDNHDSRDAVELLRSEIKTMEKRFARLQTKTIKKRMVSLEFLIGHLLAYRMFPAVRKKEEYITRRSPRRS